MSYHGDAMLFPLRIVNWEIIVNKKKILIKRGFNRKSRETGFSSTFTLF